MRIKWAREQNSPVSHLSPMIVSIQKSNPWLSDWVIFNFRLRKSANQKKNKYKVLVREMPSVSFALTHTVLSHSRLAGRCISFGFRPCRSTCLGFVLSCAHPEFPSAMHTVVWEPSSCDITQLLSLSHTPFPLSLETGYPHSPTSEVEGLESFIMSKEVRRAQENGLTLLHLVVVQGNVEKVKSLLSREANVDSQLDCGYTPLIVAVQKRSPEICSALIEHGADVNVADKDGWSPLHFAAQNRDDRIALLLLDHQARADSQEHEGWTPLHLASQNNFENVAQVLLSRQADPNCQENDGRTALHMAACFGHVSLVKLLAS